MEATTLSSAPLGRKFVVKRLDITGPMRRRLMDLGLIDGTRVTPLYESIFKNPRAYYIRGAVIALRKNDTDLITVEEEQKTVNVQ